MTTPLQAPTPLHGFLHWEQAQADTVAITEPRPDGQVVTFTWREFGDQARRMAAHLRALSLPPQSNIALLGKNSAHWLMADLAIWMAGHVSVPLYPTLNPKTADYILRHAAVPLLFVGKMDGLAEGWQAIRRILPPSLARVHLPMAPADDAPAWSDIVASTAPLRDLHLRDPQALATLIYTSGTTGQPKGVMHSFGAMVVGGQLSPDFCSFSPADRLLSYLPLAHTAERNFIETTLLTQGVQVYINDSLETFGRDLMAARPTVFISMPRLWTKFYAAACAKLPPEAQALLATDSPQAQALKKQVLGMLGLGHVRVALTGSAPLSLEVVTWYRNLGLELLEMYGMTEDFGYSHANMPGDTRLGYVGRPRPGVEARLGEDGEVLVKSPSHMQGYYREPELTAQSFTADGFFRTGDCGEYDAQGRLRITGRIKEQFKTAKGKYVAPAPIENRLSHPQIEACCVTGPGQPQPFALVLPTAEAQAKLQNPSGRQALQDELWRLLAQVNDTLEPHEKLGCLVVVREPWTTGNGFLTPTLKVRRPAIEALYLPRAAAWAEAGQPVVFDGD